MNLSILNEVVTIKHEIINDSEFSSMVALGDIVDCHDALVYIESEKFIDEVLAKQNISCIICRESLSSFFVGKGYGICICDRPKELFFFLHNYLAENTSFYQPITEKKISVTAKIYPSVFVDNGVIIGDRTIIEPNVMIYGNVEIGDDVIIRAGSVIGSEGFKFVRTENSILSVKHAGKVRIGNNVEIQSNCCIDKAIFKDVTILGEYTKLDNFVHIAHNVAIGKRCLIAANATIAGYTRIGDDVWIGPSATISNGITIGDNARVTIGTVVTKNIMEGEAVYLPKQQVVIPGGLGSKE